MAKIAGSSDWRKKLIDAQFTVNNMLNRSIGCSPARMLFGADQTGLPDEDFREILHKIDDSLEPNLLRERLRENAVQICDNLRKRNKILFDKRHKKLTKYVDGDYVMIPNVVTEAGVNQKLLPKKKGPYEVKKVLRNDRYLRGH